MRATLDERDGYRATVRLTPGWLARLFGARETLAELHVLEVLEGANGRRRRYIEEWDDGSLRWRFVSTDRYVRDTQHGELILRALERAPVSSPTHAIARLTPGRKS